MGANGVRAQVESGDVGVTATVPGPPPSTAPTIDQPTNNQVFEQKNIIVSGTCEVDLVVKVFSNALFVGSAVCDTGGNYSFAIDLFLERNDLTARQYDLLNQASPDSATVTVYYVPLSVTPQKPGEESQGPIEELPVANFQLVIDYDYTAQGVFAGNTFRLPIRFLGGTAPYTVSVDWGDGSSNSYQRSDTNKFTAEYTYTEPGVRTVIIRVGDNQGQSAYMQFVIVVQGQVDSPLALGLAAATQAGTIAYAIVFVPFVLGLGLGALIAFIIGRRKRKKGQQKAQEL